MYRSPSGQFGLACNHSTLNLSFLSGSLSGRSEVLVQLVSNVGVTATQQVTVMFGSVISPVLGIDAACFSLPLDYPE